MKKYLLVLFLSSSILLLGGCSSRSAQKSAVSPTPRARKVDVNVNLEPMENRPVVSLTPRADGRAVTLTVTEMKKQAKDLEYEIEYASGELMQGAFGSFDDLSKVPQKTEVLFGSCSSGGKCTYNENVTGGSLTLRFGSPDFTLKSEWSYTSDMSSAKTHTSRDGKLVIDFGSAKLAKKPLLIHTASGFPGKLSSSVIAGPYMITTSEQLSTPASVSLRLPLDATDGTLLAFDGKTWTEVKAKLTEKTFMIPASALSQGYVVVGK